MNDTQISQLDPKHRFSRHPRIRWKLILFDFLFYGSSMIMILAIKEFTSDSSNREFFINLSLIAMFLAVLTVIFASVFIWCPKCSKRVYTVSLMYHNKMPDKKNHHCPHCGFPKDDFDFLGGAP